MSTVKHLACVVSTILFSSALNGVAWGAAGDVDALDLKLLGEVFGMTVQPDDKAIIVGNFTTVAESTHKYVARLNPDSTPDTTFDPNPNKGVRSVAVQLDGKVLIGGGFTSSSPFGAPVRLARNYLARFNVDGTLDSSFDPNPNSEVDIILPLSDGKIILVGAFNALQPNGVANSTIRNGFARLNADGSLDISFNPNPGGTVYAVAELTDKRILIAGNFPVVNTSVTTYTRHNLACLNADGTLDLTYDPNVNGPVYAMAVQSDGKVVIGGSFSTLKPNGATTPIQRNCVARLNPDGTVDETFDPSPNTTVNCVSVQTDGKIILGGLFTNLLPNGAGAFITRNYLASLNSDGSVDTNFNPNPSDQVTGILHQANGSILVSGNFNYFTQNGAGPELIHKSFARLLNDSVSATLSVPDYSHITLLRSGSGPEFLHVAFELSTDNGTTWSALGAGSRIGTTSNWQISGLNLPTNGIVRSRGFTGIGNASGAALIESKTTYTLPPLPTVTTNAATNITAVGATLNGSVNPNGSSTVVIFEYGLTNAYGSTVTAVVSPLSGITDSPVSATISGLTPGTLYHFHARGTNVGGTVTGNDQTFTTLSLLSFTSTPFATPTTAGVNQSISFTTAATGGTGSLTYSWDFGDSTAIATGASVSHSYLATGVYIATVTVTDTVVGSIHANLVVYVQNVVGSGPDTDADGFSDSFESAVGTLTNDSASSPTGTIVTLADIHALTITSAAIKLNFAKPTLNDSITFSGTIPVPAGYIPVGSATYFATGGVYKKLSLTNKGTGQNGDDSIKISLKSKSGIIQADPEAKFTVTFKKGTFAARVANTGLTSITAKKLPVSVPFTLIFNNLVYQKLQPMLYTSTVGKTGMAK
ncbi:MAG: PKD domain-containing protein [Planctomycetota bacterium]